MVYLEGSACELGRYGHGKAGRNSKLQIQVGLLCTREGIPVSVQVFEGNTGETLTLQDQIRKVKEQFGLTRVVFVADRGDPAGGDRRLDLGGPAAGEGVRTAGPGPPRV